MGGRAHRSPRRTVCVRARCALSWTRHTMGAHTSRGHVCRVCGSYTASTIPSLCAARLRSGQGVTPCILLALSRSTNLPWLARVRLQTLAATLYTTTKNTRPLLLEALTSVAKTRAATGGKHRPCHAAGIHTLCLSNQPRSWPTNPCKGWTVAHCGTIRRAP